MAQAAHTLPENHPGQNALCQRAAQYFQDLQDRICASYEAFEPTARFTETKWQKPQDEPTQGGGRMRVMRGEVFEKVGVNFSQVWGTFSPKFAGEIPGTENDPRFWASGISLVAHMQNPYVPAVHMNLRRIETTKGWFGGGADLTPTFPFEEDTKAFHDALKAACDTYGDTTYARYKKDCDDYFYLPHRDEPRGVGGIFIEGLASGDVEADFAFIQQVGEAYARVYPEIVAKRKDTPYTEEERKALRQKRGRYAEFNLLYDRGTRFGLMTGGNTEAILMSLPPEVTW